MKHDVKARETGRNSGTGPRSFVRCADCAMRQFCMPKDFDSEVLRSFEALVTGARKVRRGRTLYVPGDRFHGLFAVRSGALKTGFTGRTGREQITSIHLSGDAIGFDGVAGDVHVFRAVALEDSWVCKVPYTALKQLCRESQAVQSRFNQLVGDLLNHEATQMAALRSRAASQRVAALLLDLMERYTQRGYSPGQFCLPMTRWEIGSYLGLTLKTVCRTMTALRKRGLIEASGKQINITDENGLRSILMLDFQRRRRKDETKEP
ncbi:MAG: helix-turn-helix domain-containing protein [Paraburkholderia sp.]|nr:helix-turn-helix domain-containing protein [Paraburkholderia sp.]